MSTTAAATAPTAIRLSDVTGEQWRAFLAVFLGWIVDAFDFNVMAFIVDDIKKSFEVDSMLAGMLATVTLVMRLVGGTASGALADRRGRKLPLMLSVLWFSLFACLSGFSSSYTMLFAFRALFGIGMGGEWAAGMPLVFEHWPTRLRGFVSGLMLGGWYWGLLFAALASNYIYPLFSGVPDTGWRVMFWIAIIPALFTLWIRSRVAESPVWLERQRQLKEKGAAALEPKVPLTRIFQRDLIFTTIHTTLVIGSFMCLYYSANYFYPKFLKDSGLPHLPFLVVFCISAIIGTAFWGRISETRLGRRGAVTITLLVGMASVPFYLHGSSPLALGFGALLMGAFGMGVWGMAPAYTNERFPTAVRGVGPGFCYHAAAGFGAIMPTLIGWLNDKGMRFADAMTIMVVASGLIAVVLIWLGPETRGRDLRAI